MYRSNKINLSVLLLLLFTLATRVNNGLIFPDRKCSGNAILVLLICVPCPFNQVAQNNQCVKLTDANYGSNLQNQDPNNKIVQGPPPTKPVPAANCAKTNSSNVSQCLQCAKNYDLVSGACIISTCKIYSQFLNKCLDNFLTIDLQALTNTFSPKSKAQKQQPEPLVEPFIIGSKPKITLDITEPKIDLALPQISLSIQPKNSHINLPQLAEKQLDSDHDGDAQLDNDVDGDGEHLKEKEQISVSSSSLPGCMNEQKNQCKQCQKGYLLNLLTHQCQKINPSIKFKLPKKHIEGQENSGTEENTEGLAQNVEQHQNQEKQVVPEQGTPQLGAPSQDGEIQQKEERASSQQNNQQGDFV